MLNEDIAKTTMSELVEKYGEVGGKIKVLGVTIKEKQCMSGELVKELSKQAEHQAQTAAERLRMESEQAKEATETAKMVAREERAEIARKASADRQLDSIKADNARQELINQQKLKDAENLASVAREQAKAEMESRKSQAELIETFPSFAQHERAVEYSKALSGQAKFVLSDSISDKLQGSVAQGNVMGWLFGGGEKGTPPPEAMAGTCQGDQCKM